MIQKSANQLWKESKTTLSFKDWLNREKEKFMNYDGVGKEPDVIINKPLNDSIQEALHEARQSAGYKTEVSKKSVFGLNKTVLIVAGVLIVAAIGYRLYKAKK